MHTRGAGRADINAGTWKGLKRLGLLKKGRTVRYISDVIFISRNYFPLSASFLTVPSLNVVLDTGVRVNSLHGIKVHF